MCSQKLQYNPTCPVSAESVGDAPVGVQLELLNLHQGFFEHFLVVRGTRIVGFVTQFPTARLPTFGFSQPIELRVAELISGVRSDVAIHIYGDDIFELKQKADDYLNNQRRRLCVRLINVNANVHRIQ